MRTLVLIRHAKAEQVNFEVTDFDRKLTSKGKEDAKLAAKELKKRIKSLNFVFSSAAKRTFKTAKIIAENFDFPKTQITLSQELYHADINVYKQIIKNFDDSIDGSFVMVGHNPSIGQLANLLSKNEILEFKPGSFAVFQLGIETWKMFDYNVDSKFDFFAP